MNRKVTFMCESILPSHRNVKMEWLFNLRKFKERYSNLIQTLSKRYSNVIQTLFKPYTNVIKTLNKRYSKVIQTLYKRYQNVIQTLFKRLMIMPSNVKRFIIKWCMRSGDEFAKPV